MMHSAHSQIVVTDARLPTDRMILEGIDVSEAPLFNVSEVAKVFFGKSSHWMRWRERNEFFVLDGVDVSGHRTDPGARRYNLSDVEKMAHSLAVKGAINGAQLTNALLMVQTNARIWGYIQ